VRGPQLLHRPTLTSISGSHDRPSDSVQFVSTAPSAFSDYTHPEKVHQCKQFAMSAPAT
jgi:hypothetical protein